MSFTCIDNNVIDVTGICDGSSIDLSTFNYWTEISIPQTLNVPEEKPDIEMVNSVNITTKIIRKKVIVTPTSVIANEEDKFVTGRKLIVEGVLCLAVEYTALNPQQSVHSAHFNLPFSAYIVLPLDINGTDTLDIDFDIVPCVEDVFIKDFNLREIFANVTLFLQAVPVATVCDEGPCNCDEKDVEIIVKGVCPETKIAALLNGTSDTTWTEIFVPEILTIPHQKPNIEELLSVASRIAIISQRVVATPSNGGAAIINAEDTRVTGRKLVIEGILKQQIMYTADVPEQSVHSAHFDVPFSVFIILPVGTLLSTKYKIDACIEDIFMCDLNPRQIFKNVTIFIKATALTCS